MKSQVILFMSLWMLTLAVPAKGQQVKKRLKDQGYLKRVELAAEIPYPIEAYTYRITGSYGGKVYFPSKVPLYAISEQLFEFGDIAVGTIIQLQYVRNVNGRHFFGFKQKKKQNNQDIEEVVWVDGRFIEIVR